MEEKRQFCAQNPNIVSASVIKRIQRDYDSARIHLEHETGKYVIPKVSNAIFTVIDDSTHILVATRKVDHDNIQIPGGKCEHGERLIDTALRETWEETGLDITENASGIHICTSFVPFVKDDFATIMGTTLTFIPPEYIQSVYLTPQEEARLSGPWHWIPYAILRDKSQRNNKIHYSTAMRLRDPQTYKQIQVFLKSMKAPKIF